MSVLQDDAVKRILGSFSAKLGLHLHEYSYIQKKQRMLACTTRCILEDIPWLNVTLVDIYLWLKQTNKQTSLADAIHLLASIEVQIKKRYVWTIVCYLDICRHLFVHAH